MSLFPEEMRRQVRQSLNAAGQDPARTDQVVDLACQAADRAAKAFAETLSLAPDGAIGLSVAEIGAQLIRHHFDGIFQAVHRIDVTTGVPQTVAIISRGGTDHG